MVTLALICIVVGLIFYLIGSIGLIIVEFKTGILWGICGLLFQIVHLLYAILHFEESKKWLGIAHLTNAPCGSYVTTRRVFDGRDGSCMSEHAGAWPSQP